MWGEERCMLNFCGERDSLGNLGIGGKIILKRMFKK
jgi:hypothetical protein